MDPHALNAGSTLFVTRSIYEPLVGRGKLNEKVPALAVEWTQAEPSRWRFVLRRNVRFHDGAPFDADDVVFSINRAKAGASGFGQYVSTIARVEIVDSHTVDVLTTGPDPLLADSLTRVLIMDRDWATRAGAEEPAVAGNTAAKFYASEHANGTGPYRLVSYQGGSRVELETYPEWWSAREGNIDKVDYLTIGDAGPRIAALLAGDVDLVADVPPQSMEMLRKRQDIRIESGPENRTIFLGFDQHRDHLLHGSAAGNPFKDRRVRQAIYQAIDAEAIRARLMEGQSLPTGFLWAPSVFGYDPNYDKRPAVDTAAARGLLKAAGYPNGFSVTLDCPAQRYVNSREICEAVGAMLARIGIKVAVNVMPFPIYISRITTFDTSFYLMGWAAPTFDALFTLQALVRSRADGTADGAWNWGRYSNPSLDALIDQIKGTTAGADRAKLMHRAHMLVRDDVAYVPIHDQMIVWAMRKNISAVLQPENQLDVKWVQIR
ncbi:MAG TPA: ABC transporter substrate-binding protein [Alphaproteobacteria bacterium]